MKMEALKERFQIELKWASYCLFYSLVITLVYAFIEFNFFSQFIEGYVLFLLLHGIVFTYLIIQCIQEIKGEERMSFFSKMSHALNVITFFILLQSLSFSQNAYFILPKKEIEIEETDEYLSDSKSNSFKDIIAFLKRKIA